MIDIIPPAEEYFKENFFFRSSPPVKVIHVDRSIEYPLHSHDFCELALIYSGHAAHITEKETTHIQAGHILYIPIGKKHSYQDVHKLSLINLIFDRKIIPGNIFNYTDCIVSRLSEFDMNLLIERVNKIDIELYRKEMNFELKVIAEMTSLLIHIQRVISQTDQLAFLEAAERVCKVVERVNRNLSVTYTLGELSEMAKTSPRNFSRIFKKLYGNSVFQYINENRIKESLKLLLESDMTITQIAFLSGFDDSSYFSVTFRKIMGFSPSVYRKRIRENNGNIE